MSSTFGPANVLPSLLLLIFAANSAFADPQPFFESYCLQCHDSDVAKGSFDLRQLLDADWSETQSSARWERVLKRIRSGEMPPAEETQPSSEERKVVLENLHQQLVVNSNTEGSVLRRLNRSEYEQSIESLLGIEFRIPDEFPPDTIQNGFDNSAAGLLLSPALMECYFDAASLAADGLFPAKSRPVKPTTFRAEPKEFAFAETAGRVVGDAIRLVARTPRVSDSCVWPAKFETRIPGKYKVRIVASRFAPGSTAIPKFDQPMKLRVYAQRVDEDEAVPIERLRNLIEFEVTSEEPKTFEFETDLRATETPVIYFANGVLSRPTGRKVAGHEPNPSVDTLIRNMLTRDKRLFAAWQQTEPNDGLQRGTAWAKLKKLRDDPELDLDTIDDSKEEFEKVAQLLVKKIGFVDPVLSHQLFEEGPALEIHSLEITGPTNVAESQQEKMRRTELVPRFLSPAAGIDDSNEKVRPVIRRWLTKAFRRPASEADITRYSSLVTKHVKSGHTLEEGFHLAIRTALISPRFLYRGHRKGKLDDWDLASRLSYFLTSAPADVRLFEAASTGKLSDPKQLLAEANRLIDSKGIDRFVSNFTGQWLQLRKLEDIKPDPRLIAWQNGHRKGMIGESERFFKEVLQTNRSLTTFIRPDFTWGNERLLNEIYGQKQKIPNWGFARIEVPKDAKFGGLLGQAGIWMATSNGTETRPVVRGVWVLRNILGDPPQPPPPETPTIEPDTRGTKTIREQLAAHTRDANCASCHRKIDPIGFVLENYDPIGRWRTHYPEWSKDEKQQEVRKNGAAIDARGEFPGDVQFEDVDDLRDYVLANLDQFGNCLSEKLMTYAIGRRPNYAERHEIAKIVAANLAKSKEGAGFRDLLLALILSETFRTR